VSRRVYISLIQLTHTSSLLYFHSHPGNGSPSLPIGQGASKPGTPWNNTYHTLDQRERERERERERGERERDRDRQTDRHTDRDRSNSVSLAHPITPFVSAEPVHHIYVAPSLGEVLEGSRLREDPTDIPQW